jgi:hypothetical protein
MCTCCSLCGPLHWRSMCDTLQAQVTQQPQHATARNITSGVVQLWWPVGSASRRNEALHCRCSHCCGPLLSNGMCRTMLESGGILPSSRSGMQGKMLIAHACTSMGEVRACSGGCSTSQPLLDEQQQSLRDSQKFLWCQRRSCIRAEQKARQPSSRVGGCQQRLAGVVLQSRG